MGNRARIVTVRCHWADVTERLVYGMSPLGYFTKSHRSVTTGKKATIMMSIRTPSDLGALIRERRTKLGLDQSSLATKAGTSRKWLIEVENGKPSAEIGLVSRTLKALGLTLTIAAAATGTARKRTQSATGTVDIDRIIDSLKRPR